jgi:hypothetical protein
VASLAQAPRRFTDTRLALFRGAEHASALLGGRALYRRRWLAPGRLAVREEVARVPGLHPALEGLTIVQLSDLHAGPFLGAGDLAHAVERANALEPDVIALTGDFVTHAWTDVLSVAPDLARLTAREGVFGVFGNHDYHGRYEARIEAALPGVRFLRNAAARIERAGAALALVGLEDLEEGRAVDIERARADVRAGDVEVVLCHNPLGARALARPGCAAILAGHTHGAQVDLPGLRRLGPCHPGARLLLGGTLVVVSRGLGALGLPVRVRAPAEIVRLTLVRSEESACAPA